MVNDDDDDDLQFTSDNPRTNHPPTGGLLFALNCSLSGLDFCLTEAKIHPKIGLW
jgi:hypothetical protein